MGLMLLSIILLVNPYTWRDETMLAIICICVFVGTRIDKGPGMISGGFVPNPLHHVSEYVPTGIEIVITIGVYAIGLLFCRSCSVLRLRLRKRCRRSAGR